MVSKRRYIPNLQRVQTREFEGSISGGGKSSFFCSEGLLSLVINLRLLYNVPLNLKTVCHLKSDSSTVPTALPMLSGCFVYKSLSFLERHYSFFFLVVLF